MAVFPFMKSALLELGSAPRVLLEAGAGVREEGAGRGCTRLESAWRVSGSLLPPSAALERGRPLVKRKGFSSRWFFPVVWGGGLALPCSLGNEF